MRWLTLDNWISHRTDVPQWLAAEVGRIAVEWSDLEWQLEEIIRLLVPTHIQHSRILTNRMSMRNRLRVAENLALAHANNKTLPKKFYEDMREFSTKIERVEVERNYFIHGHWGRREGVWQLLISVGSRELPEPTGRLPRAVLPQRLPITTKETGKARATIKGIRDELISFRQKLEASKLEAALTPSIYISPRRIRQGLPSLARKKRASSPRLES